MVKPTFPGKSVWHILPLLLLFCAIVMMLRVPSNEVKADEFLFSAAIAWDSATDEFGRLLPSEVAPYEKWQLIASFSQDIELAVPLSDRGAAIWDGDRLSIVTLGDDGLWSEIASITVTVPVSSFDLFLAFQDGGAAVVVAEIGEEGFCSDGGKWEACDPSAFIECTDVLHLPNGRWLAADSDGIYEVGWVSAMGTVEKPPYVFDWAYVAVNAPGSYHFRVTGENSTVEFEGQGNGEHEITDLEGSLAIEYEGAAPVSVSVFYAERQMVPMEWGEGLVRYEAGEVIPEGAIYRGGQVTLIPGSGMKAAMACAVWDGDETLHLVFRDVASGQDLGYTDLTQEKPCAPVWGRVNRPFLIESSADGEVRLYEITLR